MIWKCVPVILVVAVLTPLASAQSGFRAFVPRAADKASPDLSAQSHHPPVVRFSLPEQQSLCFIENRGQFGSQVKFYAKSGSRVLWFTDRGIVFDVTREEKSDSEPRVPARTAFSKFGPTPSAKKRERLVFTEEFSAGNKDAKVTASGQQPGIYNFFPGGDQSAWRTRIRSYSELVYHDVWPGIDVRFVSKQHDLEQEFVVHSGADPRNIGITYTGIDKLKVARDGSLLAMTAFGVLTERKPVVYQEIDQDRLGERARFVLTSKSSYGFRVGSFDRKRDLVIDPTLLYSTYLGGAYDDYANGIAADAAGNAYVTGSTSSPDFPTTSDAFDTQPATLAAFIVKLAPTGLPIYSTFLGNYLYGGGRGIAVSASGSAYITGNTYVAGSSGGGAFPTTSNAFQSSCYPGSNFLTVLSAAGDSLIYSTCLGGNGLGGSSATAVAVGSAGRAYLTGSANSAAPFPTTPGAYQSSLDDAPGCGTNCGDAFLTVIDPSLSGSASLVYSTFLGGSYADVGYAVAVDPYGNAYIAGSTSSSDFPTTPGALQSSRGDSFVAKFNPSANGRASLIYSTYLGGTSGASATGIAVDSSGSAYVVGSGASSGFPTTVGAFRTTGGCCGFISKLDAGGSHLLYSSFIEGDSYESDAHGIALDSLGNAYVVGSTRSDFFPVTSDAFQSTRRGDTNAFLLELNAQGTAEIYGSYLGGSYLDYGAAVAVDSTGDVYLTGNTASLDFPVTPQAFQPSWHADYSCISNDNPGNRCRDAFVTKFPLGAPGGLSITAITPGAGGNAGTVTPEILGSGFHAGVGAQLRCGGRSISGTNATPSAMGRLLNATFDLTSAQPGICDVVVTNLDGTSATLARSFTVQQGGAPNIQISLTAVARLGAPTNAAFFVTASNIGNIDSGNAFLSEYLTPGFSLTSATPPPSSSTDSSALGLSSISTALPANSSSANSRNQGSNNVNWSVIWQPPNWLAGQSQVFSSTATTTSSLPPAASWQACEIVEPAPFDVFGFVSCLKNSSIGKCTALAPCATIANPSPITSGACVVGALACGALAPNIVSQCFQQSSSNSSIYIPNGCAYSTYHVVAPSDPNTLQGSVGVGGQQWFAGAQALTYGISFANEPSATAPAQQAVVTQALSSNMNLSTLSLPGMTIPNGASSIQVPVPPGSFNPAIGLNEFTTYVDLRPTQNLLVRVDAKLNPAAQTLTWTFTSIDPATGLPPLNPLVGFLPAGTGASVSFSVRPKQGLTAGTQISTEASIVFDANQPVSTNVWSNSIDNTPPTSLVASLPETESNPSFSVNWMGSDVGSGIQAYTIYVSDNASAFTAWQTNTTATQAMYSGVAGHTYGFYSIATDLVGNVESAKTSAEAVTTVQGSSACVITLSASGTTINASGGSGTVSVTDASQCAWNAISNASWITVTAGASGSAGGMVSFSVVANQGTISRQGFVTIGGQTFTVTQAGGALQFIPVTPCRIADTRNATGAFGGPFLAGQSLRDFIIPNSICGIPSTAQAYSLNVTVVPNGPLGYLTVWPSGQAQPLVSTLNSLDGRVKANAAIVPAGNGGAITVFASNDTHLVLDIDGYFVPATSGSALAFYPVTPCRIADTRNATGSLGGPSIIGQQARTFPVLSSTCNVPSTAQAYSLNFTAVPRGPLGYLTTFATGQTQPLVSTLNAPTATVTANAAIVPVGANGAIDVFASNATDLVIDINGYFAPPANGGLSLYDVQPCRVLDTRNPSGAQPFSGALTVNVNGSACGVPATAEAYVFNATVVPAGVLGYLTLWPDSQTQPVVSTLNALDGSITSNMAIVPTVNGSIDAFASNGTHLILDISGYFAPSALPPPQKQ